MAIQISPVVASQPRGSGGTFSVQAIDLNSLGDWASPVHVLDQFRVTGRPFPPHPHAGFSAVTYVFEDSQGSLRSRDSLGNDVVTGPGGIVWTEAGSGLLHEEVPAESTRELHALQIFINLSGKNKLTAPRMLRLEGGAVPEWGNDAGDRVRVVVGSFQGISSPLIPSDPFNLFDVGLQDQLSFSVPDAHNTILYVLSGRALVQAGNGKREVSREHALAVHGSGRITVRALLPAHFLILSGAAIHEPIREYGGFIMNDRAQLEATITRYRNGQMGHLDPVSNIEGESPFFP